MPIATIQEARDEILLHFTNAWNVQTSPPLLVYDDQPRDLPNDASWARIMVEHTFFSQATLGGKVSLGGGGSRFRRAGLVTVQIFTPVGDGLTTADPLVDLAIDAFEGESTGSDRIEFRNARANEVGSDGAWTQVNVLAEFEYDRVK
jgi:hypothetical protein